MTGSFGFCDWDLWGTTKGGTKSPTPLHAPPPPFPIGADTPELALTCGRQGAPSGSERRAYAMPATSSAQPCMKYEIKKTHNFIPSYVRSHIHIVSFTINSPIIFLLPPLQEAWGDGKQLESLKHLLVEINYFTDLLSGSSKIGNQGVLDMEKHSGLKAISWNLEGCALWT